MVTNLSLVLLKPRCYHFNLLQEEALLTSWKHQLDRDSETLKIKGNVNHLRTVSLFPSVSCFIFLLKSIYRKRYFILAVGRRNPYLV